MTNELLVKHLREGMARGTSREQLVDYLIQRGYDEKEVREAAALLRMPHKPVKKEEPERQVSIMPVIIAIAIFVIIIILGVVISFAFFN
ncbi:MAG: hypothetical protein GY861_08460 [bacterium]|nr:hypothetical protein [bacterium]